MTPIDASVLSALWISYFLIHSLLASNTGKDQFKAKFTNAAHTYRLLYNISASALLLPMIYYIYLVPSEQIIQWNGIFAILGNSFAVAALIGFIYSLKFYGGMDFLGVTQYKNKVSQEVGDFVISPLHRFVRHPWYFFALIILWTRDMNAHFLLSAILMTAYFFIGSYFEEQKLKILIGKRYVQYISKVPGIFPSFKRFLTPSEAKKLTEND